VHFPHRSTLRIEHTEDSYRTALDGAFAALERTVARARTGSPLLREEVLHACDGGGGRRRRAS
jgi:hypothetical protein